MFNINNFVENAKLDQEAKILGIDPDVYKSMSEGARQAKKNAYYYKIKMAEIQASDRLRAEMQQATAAEPVEAVPVKVVTHDPARSKWLYIAIGAAVAWLILGRR